MPEFRDVQTTFTRGELDPLLRGRIDVAAYRNGADKLRNVLVIPQGGCRRRPGSVYTDTLGRQLAGVSLSGGGGFTWNNPNGGTVASLYDGDETTNYTTTTNISTTDDYVVFELDLGADTSLRHIDVVGLALSAGSSSEEFALEAKTAAGSYAPLGNIIRTVDTTARTLRRSPAQAYRYFRIVRNGTSDLGTAKALVAEVRLWTEAATASESRHFGFVFADDQRYLMLLTDRNLRIYRVTGGAEVYVADVSLIYPSSAVRDVTYAIDGDTLLLFHESYKPRKVQRQGDHDEWYANPQGFANVPQFDFGDGAEDIWSDDRGWPRCGAFFQGRLVMGGSTQRPATLIASVSSSPFDLDTSTTDDNKAIQITASPSGDEIPTIRHILQGPHLIVLTSSGEFYVPVSNDQGITPTNTTLRQSTRAGMDSQRLVPQVVDGAVYFVQREGQSIREMIFDEVEQNYGASPVSLLSSHLVRRPVEIAYRRQLSANDTNLLLFVNTDGSICAFTLLRDQEIAAFVLWSTRLADSYVGAANVKDDLYVVVERSIGGVAVRYLERLDFDVLVDCAVTGGVASGASGLEHLEGATVAIVLDGSAQPTQLVSGGAITFARDSDLTYQVGLPWPDVKAEEDRYQGTLGMESAHADGQTQLWVRLLPTPVPAGNGPTHGRRRRTPEVLLQLWGTSECRCNGNMVVFRRFGTTLLDQPTPKFTGFKRIGGVLGWGRDDGVEITQTQHLPFLLLSVTTYQSTD